MRRETMKRYGCDKCKLDTDTYVFNHGEYKKIWICERCLAVLLDWPEDKRGKVAR